MEYSIETLDLTRTFKKSKKGSSSELKAVDTVSLQIRTGELFGLLGPNGAGKTTLIKILCTLLLPTSGKASVRGCDVATEPERIRGIINMVSGGETPGYGIVTVAENLWFFSQLYGIKGSIAKERISRILRTVGLVDESNTKMDRLSSGLKQRLNLARGFINDPEVLFLDEPTVGLDVISAKEIRSHIRSWVEKGSEKTILLTTHYMAEADELCDRVAIIDHGRIVACDTPANLKATVRDKRIYELELAGTGEFDYLKEISGVIGISQIRHIDSDTTNLKLVVTEESVLSEITSAITSKGTRVTSTTRPEPTLEEVFIYLVGRGLQ